MFPVFRLLAGAAVLQLTLACRASPPSVARVAEPSDESTARFPLLGFGSVVPDCEWQCARAIAGAGDVDRDGVGDLLLGGHAFGSNAGRVVCVSGATHTALWCCTATDRNNAFGGSLAQLGGTDVYASNVFVVASDELDRATLTTIRPNDGYVLAHDAGKRDELAIECGPTNIGDVTRDRSPDIAVVYALVNDVRSSEPNRRLVVFDGLNLQRLAQRDWEAPTTARDTRIGAWAGDPAQTAHGFALSTEECLEVYELRADVLERTWRVDLAPLAIGGPLASARIGDVDGDGCDDYLAAGGDGRAARPKLGVFAFCGRSGRLLFHYIASESSTEFAFASIGDVTFDGVADAALVVSVPMAESGFVLDGTTGRAVVTLEYESDSLPDLGWRIAPLSDVDGDGVPDIAVARFTPTAPASMDQGAVVFSSRTGRELFRVACSDLIPGTANSERR